MSWLGEDVVGLDLWVRLKIESLEELKAEKAHQRIDQYSYDAAPYSLVSVAPTEVEYYRSSEYVPRCNAFS